MGTAPRFPFGSGEYKEMVVGIVASGIQGILLSPKMQKPVDIYNQDISGEYFRVVSTLSSQWNAVVTVLKSCKVEILYITRYQHVVSSAGVKQYETGQQVYNTASPPMTGGQWTIALIVR